jgi:hypothetical protein
MATRISEQIEIESKCTTDLGRAVDAIQSAYTIIAYNSTNPYKVTIGVQLSRSTTHSSLYNQPNENQQLFKPSDQMPSIYSLSKIKLPAEFKGVKPLIELIASGKINVMVDGKEIQLEPKIKLDNGGSKNTEVQVISPDSFNNPRTGTFSLDLKNRRVLATLDNSGNRTVIIHLEEKSKKFIEDFLKTVICLKIDFCLDHNDNPSYSMNDREFEKLLTAILIDMVNSDLFPQHSELIDEVIGNYRHQHKLNRWSK